MDATAAAVDDLPLAKSLGVGGNVRGSVGLNEFGTKKSIDKHDHRIAHAERCRRSRYVEIQSGRGWCY